MYGTVARLRIKPGMESKMLEHLRGFEEAKVPGAVGLFLYRMDKDTNEYYMTVMFESKQAYFANAKNPEQDARHRKLLQLLEAEPEWHDGEVVYEHMLSGRQFLG